jgi:transposase
VQQDIQCLQRIRERHIKQRTTISNQIGGFLADYGIIIEKKTHKIRAALPDILEDVNQSITVMARQFLNDIYQEMMSKDQQIKATEEQFANGENDYHGGITKRGNRQLRTLFIHGARALMNWCHKYNDRFNLWIHTLMETNPVSKVIVALANKLARMTWAVLAKNEDFKTPGYVI